VSIASDRSGRRSLTRAVIPWAATAPSNTAQWCPPYDGGSAEPVGQYLVDATTSHDNPAQNVASTAIVTANLVGMAGSAMPCLDDRPLCGERFEFPCCLETRPVTDPATARSQRIGRFAALACSPVQANSLNRYAGDTSAMRPTTCGLESIPR
jgi:hypothetical protein